MTRGDLRRLADGWSLQAAQLLNRGEAGKLEARGLFRCVTDLRTLLGEGLRQPTLPELPPRPAPIEEVTCPLCDGPMTPRTSKHGKFWGCLKYPRCKGTRNAEGEAPRRHQDARDDNDELPSQHWASRDHQRRR